MAHVWKFIGRVFVGLILIVFLLSFVVIFSVNQELDEKIVTDILIGVAINVAEEKIAERGFVEGEIDFDEIYNNLTEECGDDSFIEIEEFDLKLDCSKIDEFGEDGIEDYYRGKISDRISLEIDKELGEIEIGEYISVVGIVIWVIGVFSFTLILSLFFLSVPRYKFAVDLGMITLVVGLPFLIVKGIDLTSIYSGGEVFDVFVDSILGNLFRNFVIAFVVGVILIIIGFSWKRIYKEKNPKEKKKSKK